MIVFLVISNYIISMNDVIEMLKRPSVENNIEKFYLKIGLVFKNVMMAAVF